MIQNQRYHHVAKSLGDSENRGHAAVSISERLTPMKNSQPPSVVPRDRLTPFWPPLELGWR